MYEQIITDTIENVIQIPRICDGKCINKKKLFDDNKFNNFNYINYNIDIKNILYHQNKYIIPCLKIVDNNSIKFTYILDEKLNIYNKIDTFDLNCACNDNILIVNKKYYDFKNKIEIYDAENFIFWLDNKAIEYFNKEKKLIFKKFIEIIIKNNIQCECLICFNNIMNRVALIPCGHAQF